MFTLIPFSTAMVQDISKEWRQPQQMDITTSIMVTKIILHRYAWRPNCQEVQNSGSLATHTNFTSSTHKHMGLVNMFLLLPVTLLHRLNCSHQPKGWKPWPKAALSRRFLGGHTLVL